MSTDTRLGTAMSGEVLRNYIRSLIDRVFKILPLWESREPSLPVYLESLQGELAGCREFVRSIHEDRAFLSILSILQYLIDTPQCGVKRVKREVFRCISLCNELAARYAAEKEV